MELQGNAHTIKNKQSTPAMNADSMNIDSNILPGSRKKWLQKSGLKVYISVTMKIIIIILIIYF